MELQAYIGINPCGCITAAMIDDADTSAERVAEFAKNMAKTGRKLKHITFDPDKEPLIVVRCKCNIQ